MKEYYTNMTGIEMDNLIGGHEVVVHIENARLTDNISVERGELLARDSQGKYHQFTSSDANKYVVIARESAKSTDNRVISAYSTGLFNRNMIKVSESIDLSEYELMLREQGIMLTSVKMNEEITSEEEDGSEAE